MLQESLSHSQTHTLTVVTALLIRFISVSVFACTQSHKYMSKYRYNQNQMDVLDIKLHIQQGM